MFPVSYILPFSRHERVKESNGEIADFINKIKSNPSMLDADIHDFYDSVADRDGLSINAGIATQTPEHMTQIKSIRARQKAALIEAYSQLSSLEARKAEIDEELKVAKKLYESKSQEV